MAVALRSVRVALVAVTVLLLVVLASYIGYGYARRKAQDALRELPHKLGMDITQDSDNFTYSQTSKGKTIFTVRASKALEHKNGLITLREVNIELFGPTGTRHDRMHGHEFEFNRKNGILTAVGEALIDLEPPTSTGADEAHMIHVRTSGLVLRKEDGTAETKEAIEFTENGMVGQATGATYDSKTSRLILQSAVMLNGKGGAPGHEHPVLLTATHAEMERTANVVLLENPRYVSTGDGGEETLAAAQATVHTSADGKPTAVEARGHVQLAGAGRGILYAERMDVQLNDEGQPRDGHVYGGVRFLNNGAAKQELGVAQDAHVSFDGSGKARHALLTGTVQLSETVGASSRVLNADRLDLTLSGGGKEKVVLQGATATGGNGARVHVVEQSVKGIAKTDVRAATLTGRFGPMGLTGLDGVGKTYLQRVETNPAGLQMSKETSTGDTLAVELRPGAKRHTELARAVQRGSVEIVSEAAAKKAGLPPEVEHARAEVGDYDADRDELTLTGGVEVSDAVSAVFADKVQIERATGEALAEGAVRVSYAQGKPGTEPVHVLASRAEFHKVTGLTHFTGNTVRMWQGGSQVEAPVIDLDRAKKTLVAYGAGIGDTIHATLARQPAKAGGKAFAPANIVSKRMSYTDATRQLDFAGDVQVKEATSTLHAADALIFFAASAQAKVEVTENLLGGKLERIVGSGGVLLEQPGSKAAGDRIVYTAVDDMYVLTGTKAAPPRLDDATRGSVTGTQLRFKRGDESVEVVGGDGGRVRSEPRARQ